MKYKDIFPFPISDKNKGNIDNKKDNLDNYLFCCNKSSLLKEFFNKSYLEVFEEYYFQNKRVINLNGLDILLSEKTGTFNNLLNKGNNSSIKHVFLLIINELYYLLKEQFDEKYTIRNIRKLKRYYPVLSNEFVGWLSDYADTGFRDYEKYDNKIIYDLSNLEDYERAIIDYLSGMTDKYIIARYNEIISF